VVPISRYLIRVHGQLSEAFAESFPDLEPSDEPAQTVLVGELPDQAALTAVLERLDMYGVEVREVVRVPDSPAARGAKAQGT
jgi:hypothetical protein